MTPRIDHVALWARDLERLRAFYVDVLGGAAGPRYHNPATGFSSYFVSFGAGARLELMSQPALADAPGAPAYGWAHVALVVGDRAAVDERTAALLRHGVTVVSGPRQTGDGYYEAVVMDPEGNRIELVAG